VLENFTTTILLERCTLHTVIPVLVTGIQRAEVFERKRLFGGADALLLDS
jgi:hypothetical protein